MAYMKVPPIAPNVCLVAMNSPFLNSASDYTCRLEDLSPLWIKEIRSRQATGPYILGGWSAGGYYSFEIAKQLLREGEKVEKLILIDSPCRLVFEELSMEVVTYLSENDLMGNWGAKGAPDWLIKHFGSSLKTIRGYMPTPLGVDESDLPEVFIIWAANGVLQDTGISAAQTELDTSRKTTQFLVVGRDDFGPVGWDRLFPGRRISIAKMPGHHFSIVHPPNVGLTSPLSLIWRNLVN
jgi:thioesterase domain-containing protein